MTRLLLMTSAAALFAAPALAQGDYDQADPKAPAAGYEAPVVLDADETQTDVDGDGDLETLKNGYADQHAWIDAPVYADGEQVGDVERVHYAGEEIDAIVIETPGVGDLGGREIEIALEHAELTADESGATTFTLTMSKAELDAMPDFDESTASDYPLSDNPAENDDGYDLDAEGIN